MWPECLKSLDMACCHTCNTHTCTCTVLPDLFLAFDLYHMLKDEFVCRPVLSALLKDTDIQQVPLMMEVMGSITTHHLCQMTSLQSAFCDGPMEGEHLHVQDNGRTVYVHRFKIVQADGWCSWQLRLGQANHPEWTTDRWHVRPAEFAVY